MIMRSTSLVAAIGLTIAGTVGYFYHLATGTNFDPVLVEPFELFPVYWYGVIVLIAVGVGFVFAYAQPAVDESPSNQKIWRYVISIVIAGIMGARLFDVFFITPIARQQGIRSSWDYFENPVFLVDFSWGGLNIWGAIIGGGVMLIWICWRTGLLPLPIFFKTVVGFLIGLSLAQWGHFINQELYGIPVDRWWAVSIDPTHRLPIFESEERFVPLFLMAAIWYLAGGLWLATSPRWQRSSIDQLDGVAVGLIWFIVGRMAIELNTPNSLFNWLSAVLLLVIIFGAVRLGRNFIFNKQ